MRHKFEPAHDTRETLIARIELAHVMLVLLAAGNVELLNTTACMMIGSAVFQDPDRFKDIGSLTTFNAGRKELIVTVYLSQDDGDTMWFRHFGIKFCEEHGLHLTELLPPFLVDDTPEDSTVFRSTAQHRNVKLN